MTSFNENKLRRIAVLTGGGDAPGMNACVRAVVRTASAHELDVYAIRHAYAGLVSGEVHLLGPRDVGGILHKGGTVLHTARFPEFKELAIQKKAIRCLHQNQIDALIVIGGNGSLAGALALHQLGFPIIGIPATIDNDVWGSDMAIGVDTAINTILDSIDKLRDTASSHERAFLLETMGRQNGYLALMGGITGGAEVIILPEIEITLEEIAERLEQAYVRGKTHAIIVNSEGSPYPSTDLMKYLNEEKTGFDVRMTILGHVQRGGRPTGYDRLLATRFGCHAVQKLLNGTHGVMLGLSGSQIKCVPLEDVSANKQQAELEYYELARILAR